MIRRFEDQYISKYINIVHLYSVYNIIINNKQLLLQSIVAFSFYRIKNDIDITKNSSKLNPNLLWNQFYYFKINSVYINWKIKMWVLRSFFHIQIFFITTLLYEHDFDDSRWALTTMNFRKRVSTGSLYLELIFKSIESNEVKKSTLFRYTSLFLFIFKIIT